jgi:hypothetical protein
VWRASFLKSSWGYEIDPLTILLAARACVTAIQQGTALYKQAKTAFMEVKSIVEETAGVARQAKSFWAKLFGTKEEPMAQAARKKEKFVAVDETKVLSDIVSQLSTFFRLQEQLAETIRVEEERSKNVYDPDANLMEAALHRIMAQDQMAILEREIREAMVYGAPAEMGALYSRTFATRDIIKAEQEKARKKRDEQSWQRKEKERLSSERQAYLLATLLCLLYLWALLILLSRTGS